MGKRKRDLTRDEVFVGGSRLPREWARDNAYASYRFIKASGWPGRICVLDLLALWLASMTGIFDDHPEVASVFLGIGAVALVVSIVRVYRRRRRF